MTRIEWIMIKTPTGLIGKVRDWDAAWIGLDKKDINFLHTVVINKKSDEAQVDLLQSFNLPITEIQEYFDNENNMANSS